MDSRDPRIIAFVMAGGAGSRLRPLTVARGKPAVPFGSKYRIIDFVLSNLVNSGYRSIYVLVQYLAQSLIEHLRRSWNISRTLGKDFVTAVPPQQRVGEFWFKGTADSIHQNRNLVTDNAPDIVLVFGADHIYRMDVSQMVRFHLERGADATISALPVPIEDAREFGVLAVNEAGRVERFDEKHPDPRPMPGDPSRALCSMGNYVFSAQVLMDALISDAAREGEHDFGRTVIPALLGERKKLYAYDFLQNEIPGMKASEKKGYWRDVGTIKTYWETQMDLLGEAPLLDLSNLEWPIHTSPYPGPGSRVVSTQVENALIGEGCQIAGARIDRSVIGRGVMIEKGAEIIDSIVMDHTLIGAGAKIEKAIVDRFNRIEAGASVVDGNADAYSGAVVDPSGIVVLPRGFTRPAI